ncbi:MAG: flagellar biosynthesis protein FlgL [Paracoccaceae bacterium]
MTLVSFGDLAQSFLLKSQTARLKGEVGRLTQEFSSGRISDVGAELSGDLGRLASISRARSITQGYQSAAREASAHVATTQTALGSIAGSVQSLVPNLLTLSQQHTANSVLMTGEEARGRLDGVLATLNTTAGGRSLFAGQDVDAPAVVDASTILTALRGEVLGAETAQQTMDRISAWFDDPAGYRATAYRGGPPLDQIAVSPTDQVWIGVTAQDPAILAMLKGLTMAAMIEESALLIPATETRHLARLSADALLAGQDAMTQLAARLGLSEARIDTAQSRNAVDLLAHEMAQADLVRSDPERAAIELEALQTNLETVYAITARLSRLSLTDFLR